jgi:hypothetical protein
MEEEEKPVGARRRRTVKRKGKSAGRRTVKGKGKSAGRRKTGGYSFKGLF